MRVIETKLPGVVIIEPRVFGDARGFLLETWHQSRYGEIGLPANFVQDNLSFSIRGTLRGLHFQTPNSQGKLVYVLQGEVFDVAVDIRVGSPTFGRWVGVVLSGDNKRQLYIPEGFAHGFCVTSESALFAYKCTDLYNPQAGQDQFFVSHSPAAVQMLYDWECLLFQGSVVEVGDVDQLRGSYRAGVAV